MVSSEAAAADSTVDAPAPFLLPLCGECRRVVAGEAGESLTRLAEQPWQCALCMGILDPHFIDKAAQLVESRLQSMPYDASSFVLALNLPTTQQIRESIIKKAYPQFNGILVTVPFKLRNINCYLQRLSNASGLRPTLHSDLQLTIEFVNDEFKDSDFDFFFKQFPNEFRPKGRNKRFQDEFIHELTKEKMSGLIGRVDENCAKSYALTSPTHECSIDVHFERDPIYIAGRYCKYSRSLPQSPWSAEEDGEKIEGNSVSEKVCGVLQRFFGASETRFVASGREDIDVRMLGEGRPFVAHLINCQRTRPVDKASYEATLRSLQAEMNRQADIGISQLTRVSRPVAEQLSVGQEEKKKWYTAYCYSTLPIAPEAFEKAKKQIPVEVIQKTPVRVLKRRALLDRPRSIYHMETLPIDQHHFLVRLETQAGTYIKEFVHGDFGRTRPSLADLLEVEMGEVDILELDVERVDLEWPPTVKEGEKPF